MKITPTWADAHVGPAACKQSALTARLLSVTTNACHAGVHKYVRNQACDTEIPNDDCAYSPNAASFLIRVSFDGDDGVFTKDYTVMVFWCPLGYDENRDLTPARDAMDSRSDGCRAQHNDDVVQQWADFSECVAQQFLTTDHTGAFTGIVVQPSQYGIASPAGGIMLASDRAGRFDIVWLPA